jgi:hypothetical protein
LVLTPSRVLIVACARTCSLYAVQPVTGDCKLIAGIGKSGVSGNLFDGDGSKATFTAEFGGLTLDASESCLFVSDSSSGHIRRVTLPAQWFERQSK